jgi:tripartite ATP-independent transporter DctP family solute receptor
MKMQKSFLGKIVLAGLMFAALSVVGCSSSDKQDSKAATASDGKNYTFKLAHVNNPNHPYTLASKKFAELVNKSTNGHVTVEVYDSGTLGNENDIIEQVQMGSIQFGLVASAPFANTIPEMYVFDLPFLFSNRPNAYKVLDGEIGKNILAKLDSQGMVGLGFWENGFRDISNGKHKVVTPADLKGLKIRTMENKIHMASFNAMGAVATPMAWSEVFTALQQGTMDGLENSPVIYSTNAFYEVQKYLSLTGHFYSPAVFFCNKEMLQSLPKEYQTAIINAEKEARNYERKCHEDMDNKALAVLKEHGMEITDVDKNVWRKSCESVYKQYREQIGGKLIDAILAVK